MIGCGAGENLINPQLHNMATAVRFSACVTRALHERYTCTCQRVKRSLVAFYFTRRLRGFTCRPTFYLYTSPVSHVDHLAFHIVGCAVSHVDHLASHVSTAISHVNHGTVSHVFESDFTCTGRAISGGFRVSAVWVSCVYVSSDFTS